VKYHLITLGCPKNKVDSDGIEMLLRNANYRPTDRQQDADVLIVNTCGFLEASKEESIGVLQELGAANASIKCWWRRAVWCSATAPK
jgi:ribosomal protein S12 methylthiotransferase